MSSDFISSESDKDSAVQLAIIGTVGSLKSKLLMVSIKPLIAGSINPEWKAPPTRKGITFFAPRVEHISKALATAILEPLITICSEVFTLDT